MSSIYVRVHIYFKTPKDNQGRIKASKAKNSELVDH